jgi:hypothetical protein
MSFLTGLSVSDIQRLRECVRRIHMKNHPTDVCTAHEADRIIEALGPRVAEEMIEIGINSKLIAQKLTLN